MSYLEELLPEFRKGAKIRCNDWSDDVYIFVRNGEILPSHPSLDVKDDNDLISNKWEFYQEPIDWDYIIKNKCLCWFWDNDDKYKSIEKLAYIHDKADYPFENTRGGMYRHCHPIFKDEVTFYENKNNE